MEKPTPEIKYILTLTEEEARLVKATFQNPPEDADEKMRELYEAIFNLIPYGS